MSAETPSVYPIDSNAPASMWALCFSARYGTIAAILDRIAAIIREGALDGAEPAILQEYSAIAAGLTVECQGGEMPVGAIIWGVMGLPPDDSYLAAEGQSLPASSYPELAAIVDRNWLTPDESTIVLPDMRGRVAAGGDASAGTGLAGFFGTYEGAKAHALTEQEMPVHTHDTNLRAVALNAGAGAARYGVTGTGQSVSSATGGNVPHNNMQPTHYLRCYIKVR